jgi:predicted metal-dependent phosphoesterase TrpH
MEKIDMHIFTTISHPREGAATPKEAVKIAIKRGMQGLGIADHDRLGAAKEAREFAPKDFIILEGVEIRALEGHVVAFGIEKCDLRFVPLVEVLDFIKDNDGLALLPHPNIKIMATSIVEPFISEFRKDFEGMYLLSTRHLLFYPKLKEVYDKYGFPGLGCSYAHHPFEIGTAFSKFNGVSNEDDVISAVRKGRVWAGVLKTPRGIFNILRSNGNIAKKFTIYKFGDELKQRIPLYYKSIWMEILNLRVFTRESLLKELFKNSKLPPDSRRDTLLILTLDRVLEIALKEGSLVKIDEKMVLKNESESDLSLSMYLSIYSRYMIGLLKDLSF